MIFNTSGVKDRLLKVVHIYVRTATKRASGGKSANNNTAGRRLGPKKGEGEYVEAGQILWRQRGTSWYPGENTGIGRDHTIYAQEPGFVRMYRDPFHPKRRFIGIALGKEDRLPTPHFEPRRRRFGYKAIDEPTVAEFEKEYISKKETELAFVREQEVAEREAKRAQMTQEYVTILKELVPGLEDSEYLVQSKRFIEIKRFVLGAVTFEEARALVDRFAKDDLKTDLRTGRLSQDEFEKANAEMDRLAETVDKKVMLGPNKQLVAFVEPEQATKAYEDAIAELSTLTKDVDRTTGTPEDIKSKVEEVLTRPIFTASQVQHLRHKFLLRPSPVKVTKDTLDNYSALVKKGDGELKLVWDQSSNRAHQYYIPKGAALVF